MKPPKNEPLYNRVRQILEQARSNVARSVNTTQVVAYSGIHHAVRDEFTHIPMNEISTVTRAISVTGIGHALRKTKGGS